MFRIIIIILHYYLIKNLKMATSTKTSAAGAKKDEGKTRTRKAAAPIPESIKKKLAWESEANKAGTKIFTTLYPLDPAQREKALELANDTLASMDEDKTGE